MNIHHSLSNLSHPWVFPKMWGFPKKPWVPWLHGSPGSEPEPGTAALAACAPAASPPPLHTRLGGKQVFPGGSRWEVQVPTGVTGMMVFRKNHSRITIITGQLDVSAIVRLSFFAKKPSNYSILFSHIGCNKMHPVAGRTKALWISRQICFVEWPVSLFWCVSNGASAAFGTFIFTEMLWDVCSGILALTACEPSNKATRQARE